MRVTASAPGKVVICGEYAVLDGAPAICMAVDRRARVTVTPGGNDGHTVTAPGHAPATARFTDVDGEFAWLEHGDSYSIVEHVWRAASLRTAENLHIELDSREFVDPETGAKLGIGSSAAVTVALIAALDEATCANLDLQVAMSAHRQLQSGRGSGVDVATSLLGGVIEYRMNRAVSARQWPAGLFCTVFWSGESTSTAAKIDQLAATANRKSRAALAEAAEGMAAAWSRGNAQEVFDGLSNYTAVLDEFSVDHDLGIFNAGHREMSDGANGDVVYKPCGAGGGDIGIALACDEAVLTEYAAAAADRGFRRLDTNIEPQGVARTREDH